MSVVPIAIVVARARNGVIGRDGGLPWRLKADLQLFKANTLGKPVIMGRKTWDSLQLKPLPRRTNIVLSRDQSFTAKAALVCDSWSEALSIGREQAAEDGAAEVCVIGGEGLFTTALPRASRLYLTEVAADVEGDARFPDFDEAAWTEVRREAHAADDTNDHAFEFRLLERR